jgi:hypothetical protein
MRVWITCGLGPVAAMSSVKVAHWSGSWIERVKAMVSGVVRVVLVVRVVRRLFSR